MNYTKQPKLVRKTLLATAVAAIASPAMSQMALEEVVVTAQKREQTLQDIPASVAAITSESLAFTSTQNFEDLGKITSGVTLIGDADGFGSVIRIRGVGNNAFAPAIRPSVGIFVNEVPLLSLESAYNNLADVERIEILKGPQSTLFGKEVSAGAISLTTKKPDVNGKDFYVEGNFGNLDLQEYRIGGNLNMGDMFAIRASYYNSERGETVKNLADIPGIGVGEGQGDFDKEGYRLRLGFEPTDNFSAILSYEEHEVDVYGSTSVAQQYGDLYTTWGNNVVEGANPEEDLQILDPFDRVTSHNAPTDRSSKTEMWSLHLQWDITDNWTLTSVTADQDYAINTTGLDGSSFVNENGEVVPDTADLSVGPYKIAGFYQDQGSDGLTQELRASFDSDNWSSIIGLFYADTTIDSYVPFTSPLGALPSGTIFQAAGVSDLVEDIEEWAIFNHNIWSVTEDLDFTFGIRYSETEKESVKGQLTGWGPIAELNTPPVPVTPWGAEIPTQKDTWDSVTGTLKLNWFFMEDVAAYIGWDRGYKAGGHNVCKGTDLEPNCPDPFDEETADNFELGFKGRFFDNTLSWNGAIFYQKYDDYQVEIQDEEGVGNSILNAAGAEIEGIETEFQWLPTDKLLIDGSISYVDARWDDYTNAGCIRPQYQAVACTDTDAAGNPVQDLSGKRINNTSPWTANLNLTWSDTLANGMNWYIRGEYTYRDDRFFFPDLDPQLTDDDYNLFNASIGFTGASDNWDIIIWGKNLTDEDYLASGARNRDAGNPNFGTVPIEGYRVSAGEERTYGITLKYRWFE